MCAAAEDGSIPPWRQPGVHPRMAPDYMGVSAGVPDSGPETTGKKNPVRSLVPALCPVTHWDSEPSG